MKRLLKVIFVAIICIVLSIGMFNVNAANVGTVLYQNDFSKGIDSTMNYNAAGSCEITTLFGESFLRCTPLADGTRAFRINFGPEEAKNVDISFRIRSTSAQSNASAFYGLYFRCPSIPANFKFAYQLRLNSQKTSLICMDDYADTVQTVLTEDANTTFTDCLWYNVKVSLRENRIAVFVNGNMVMDFEDDYYLPLGGFGLCSSRYTFDVDDIKIIGYKGKLPEPTPNEAPIWVGEPFSDYKKDIPDSGKERLNLSNLGGEKGDGTTEVSVVNPNELTINSWIAISLIAALVIMAVSTLIVSLKLFKLIKDNKATADTSNSGTEEKGVE